MLNSIVDAISIKLNSVFGDGFEIYSNNVEQGLLEPCFFIQHLSTSNKPYIGKRKERTYSFDVHYFTDKDKDDLMAVSDEMLDALEYITLVGGDMLRGLNLDAQIIDDVLHVNVQYSAILTKTEEFDTMEDYTLNLKGN